MVNMTWYDYDMTKHWQNIEKFIGFRQFHMVGRLFEPIEIRESQGFSSTTSETSETCNLENETAMVREMIVRLQHQWCKHPMI